MSPLTAFLQRDGKFGWSPRIKHLKTNTYPRIALCCCLYRTRAATYSLNAEYIMQLSRGEVTSLMGPIISDLHVRALDYLLIPGQASN